MSKGQTRPHASLGLPRPSSQAVQHHRIAQQVLIRHRDGLSIRISSLYMITEVSVAIRVHRLRNHRILLARSDAVEMRGIEAGRKDEEGSGEEQEMGEWDSSDRSTFTSGIFRVRGRRWMSGCHRR